MSRIKEHTGLKSQADWIIEFLKSIHISQNNENMPIYDMEADSIDIDDEKVELKIILFETEDFERIKNGIEEKQALDELYIEKRQSLELFFYLNQEIHFNWKEELCANSEAYDLYDLIPKYIRTTKLSDVSATEIAEEEFNIEYDIIGSINDRIHIIEDTISLSTPLEESEFKKELLYEEYPKTLQHFIKELVWHRDSWQKHFFPWQLDLRWKPTIEGAKDLIIRSDIKTYINEVYGKAFFDSDLLNIPTLIHFQLLEFADQETYKFNILKDELLAYYDAEGHWPKDLLEVIFNYYAKKLMRPLDEFENSMLFIFMRFYHFSFQPEALTIEFLYQKMGEERPDIVVGDLYSYDSGYHEWQEWIKEIN